MWIFVSAGFDMSKNKKSNKSKINGIFQKLMYGFESSLETTANLSLPLPFHILVI